jgi:hypothetical protein
MLFSKIFSNSYIGMFVRYQVEVEVDTIIIEEES